MSNASLNIIGVSKLEEITRDISRRFGLSLLLRDCAGSTLCYCMDYAREPARQATLFMAGQETVSLPIRFRKEIVATLVVDTPRQHDRDISGAIAACLEYAIMYELEIADLSGEVIRSYEELSQMYALTDKLGSEMDVDTICGRVLEETEKILEVRNLSILLLDPDGATLRAKCSVGKNAVEALGFTASASSGLIGQVLHQGIPVTLCDIVSDNQFALPYPASSILCVPLITDGKAIGLLLAVDKLSNQEFWSRELKLMGMFAMEIAASIMKAQLYQDINSMFINTVEAFASAIDAKDPYTYGHSRRVARISVAMCEELGMPKQQTSKVELAALLHDIGKIGTPENILHKPGILQSEEFEKIKEHPGKGAEILSGIKEFNEIVKWIRHHHEWYDGRGYPDRIAAEEIPVEARIITIADAYDAMTSDRPYRKGMPHAEVIKIMEEFTITQFDPHILAAFKTVILTCKIDLIEKTSPFQV